MAKILQRFDMADSKPAPTPMTQDWIKSSLDSPASPLPASLPYLSAIGSLMYLMICTRPDLAYSVGRLSQFCEAPVKEHWTAIKRVFRYIRGSQNVGLRFGPCDSLKVEGYCDSDWGGCPITRKSTEGIVFKFGGAPVVWKSKKQSIVALSSCEAEYVALCSAAKEAIWLSRLLADMLTEPSSTPVPLHVDNDGSIDLAKNQTVSQRTKHVDIRYHFIREAIQKRSIKLFYISTENQLADPLTKPLSIEIHKSFASKLGLSPSSF